MPKYMALTAPNLSMASSFGNLLSGSIHSSGMNFAQFCGIIKDTHMSREVSPEILLLPLVVLAHEVKFRL
jgi:hypothetical protein